MAFIFGGNTNLSYEDIQRKRRIADALMSSLGAPRDAGEGLSAIGKALAIRGINRQTDKADAQNRKAFNEKWASLFPQGAANQGGTTVSTSNYAPPPAFDPNSPQAIGRDTMVALGKAAPLPNKDEVASYIQTAAEAKGIDPQIALAVARSEGLDANPAEGWQSNFVKDGKRERSYGPFQLYVDGGLGNEFQAKTGLDPSNPDTWKQQVDFALDHASKNGWGAWYGADRAGIGEMQGIGGSPDMVSLAEIAGDPYASPGQKALVQALLGQQVQGMDPAYQLDLQIKQSQLDKAKSGGDMPEMVRQRLMLAERAGLDPASPEYQQFILTGNTVGRGANEYGLNPIYGRDENGDIVVMQLGKDGVAAESKLPDGITPDLAIKAEETARGTKVGAGAGEAAVDLSGARVSAERTIGLIDDLANDPYLPKMLGPIDSRLPNVSASSQRIRAKMDQLQGAAFLEAYNMLRNGGQITEVEGVKAENAMARLRAAQNETDYRSALQDFRDAVETGLAKLEARSKATTAPASLASPSMNDDEYLKSLGLQ